MTDKRIFEQKNEVNSNIMFLAKHSGKIRLLCIQIDPYLVKDEKSRENNTIFLFRGAIDEEEFNNNEIFGILDDQVSKSGKIHIL